jgi:hypothetical protein
MGQAILDERPQLTLITASDGTTCIGDPPATFVSGQLVSQFRNIQGDNGQMVSGVGEGLPVSPPADASFHSLGPLKLCGRFSRANVQVNLANTGSLPAGGAQFQILGKASVNAPWFVMYSWAQIQALTSGPSSGDASLLVFTDQATLVFPKNSNVAFNFDVRGWWAVDVQISLTAGAFSAVAQPFVGLKANS